MKEPLINVNTTEGFIIGILILGAMVFLIQKIGNSNYVKERDKKVIKDAIKYARKKGIKRERQKPAKPLPAFLNPFFLIFGAIFIGWLGLIVNAFLSMGLFGAFLLGMIFMSMRNNNRN